MEDGKLIGGEFTADMTSINVTDLEGDSKEKLTGHLRSDDFFGVETHKTAKFVITTVAKKTMYMGCLEILLSKEIPIQSRLI